MSEDIVLPSRRSGPRIGTVEIRTHSPALLVRALIGEEGATITDGYGGWQTVERARRTALTQWQGRSPYVMRLPLVISQWKIQNSIETRLRSLERMATPPRTATPPPVVRISGAVPHADLAWVIDKIEMGNVLSLRSGERSRVEVTLTLYQYVADDLAADIPPLKIAQDRAQGHGPPRAPKSVGDGDTLSKIAADVYGEANRWHEIAKANDIRDPSNLEPGRVLTIP